MRELVIGDRTINDGSDAFVVAEIGQNHCGSMEIAREMITAAKYCGCDAVKFQKRTIEELYHPNMLAAPYLGPQSFGATYGDHRRALEFDKAQHRELKEHADRMGIVYFATAWDFKACDDLKELGVGCVKIASGDLNTPQLIRYVSRLNVPVIISTGGAAMADIKRAVDSMTHDRFALLHCVASYPNMAEEMNLLAISVLRDTYRDTVIGLSDHFNGISMATPAYMIGARVFEKHFTLNHTWKGTDHALSLEPKGMHDMVRDLRRVRVALGDGVKRRLDTERPPLMKMEKGLYYKTDKDAGEMICSDEVIMCSPSAAMYPYDMDKAIGRTLRRSVKAGEPVKTEDLI